MIKIKEAVQEVMILMDAKNAFHLSFLSSLVSLLPTQITEVFVGLQLDYIV